MNVARILFFLCVLLYSCSSPVRAQIEVPVVFVLGINGVNPNAHDFYNSALPTSRFSAEMQGGMVAGLAAFTSDDYAIYGGVYTNCTSPTCEGGSYHIQASVDPLRVTLFNGPSTVYVDLRGTIGGIAISNIPITIDSGFINTGSPPLNYRANIQIIGDIDESSVSVSHQAGVYQGSFTITISIP